MQDLVRRVHCDAPAPSGTETTVRSKTMGFTLVELLVVVVILGILVAAVVPQFTDHTNDARLATIDRDLTEVRAAIERYYQEHRAYPGAVDPASGTAPAADPDQAFVQQLTTYTDASGRVSPTRSAVFRYGPYLRHSQLPVNPFRGDNTLVADGSITSLTAGIYDGSSAWKYAVPIGRFIANSAPEHADR